MNQRAEKRNKELQAKADALEARFQSTTASFESVKRQVRAEVEKAITPLRDEVMQLQVAQ